jgi:hypothetical protein
MKRLLSHLSYANVVATICLFMILGGGAYAATQLPKNSVGPKQLKKGAVTPAKVSKAARKQLRGETGPAGPVGPVGPGGAGPTFMAFKDSDELVGKVPKTVLTLPNLPAGSYAIFAKLAAFTGEEGKVIHCALEARGVPGNGAPDDEASVTAGGGTTGTVVLQTVQTFSAPGGSVRISCSEDLGKPTDHLGVNGLRITAIQVQSQSSVAG